MISIGIEDIMRRLLYNILLYVVGIKSTRTCGTNQLYSGVDTVNEGGIYHVRSMWNTYLDDGEHWGGEGVIDQHS